MPFWKKGMVKLLPVFMLATAAFNLALKPQYAYASIATFHPVEDSYTTYGSADENFGDVEKLIVKQGGNKNNWRQAAEI